MYNTVEIYKAIRSILPSNYKIKFTDMSKKDTDTCCLYIKSGGNIEREVDGTVAKSELRLILNINSNDKIKGVEEGYSYCHDVVDKLINTYNKNISIEEKDVFIREVRLVGNINYLGKNEYGIPTYSINYIIYL